MPGGPVFDSAQSYVAFTAIKFVGYTISTAFFNRRYSTVSANPFLFGLARTLLGMTLGAVAGVLGLITFELVFVVFLVGLIPFRIAEWWTTLWFFYRKDEKYRELLPNNIALGTVWSFVLDIPAIFGFIVTGGFWIC